MNYLSKILHQSFRAIIIICIILNVNVIGDSQKGATPLSIFNSKQSIVNNTYAVIVGISDYQSPQIPDLKYADRDAIAFAEWLKSNAGGNVPSENIELLINEKASFARVTAALDYLQDSIKSGEQAIIYFSGHGDLETKTRNQFGFLLCWDSPPTNYKCGAYSVPYLQDVVSTISDKKTKVILITDACHAGKLAGSSIGGPNATAQALAHQFANEVKIMSCQPDEYAIEGVKWGGGRGVFSFFLLKGLTGLADKNRDGLVNLFEIQRYLEDKVVTEAEPHSQLPMTEGDPKTILVKIDSQALNQLMIAEEQEKNNLTVATNYENDAEKTNSDSNSTYLYSLFNAALDSGYLLEPAEICANDLYLRLLHYDDMIPMQDLMRRNLVIALQDEVQQALNALLESDPYEVHNWSNNPDKYKLYPTYLSRAMELLGEHNKSYASLKSKKLYFEAYLLKKNLLDKETNWEQRKSGQNKIKGILIEAYQLDSNSAYICHAIAGLYYLNVPLETDSVLHWIQKAVNRSPRWILPYIDMAFEYQVGNNEFKLSEEWLMKAVAIDSNSIIVMERLAWLRQRQNRTDETIEICKKIIGLKPELPNGYSTLSHTFAFRRDFYSMLEYYNKSEGFVDDYISYEPYFLRNKNSVHFIAFLKNKLKNQNISQINRFCSTINLALIYYDLGYLDLSLEFIRLSEQNIAHPWYMLEAKTTEGKIMYEKGKLKEADTIFKSIANIDPSNPRYPKALAWIATLESESGSVEKADTLFQEAINSWLGSAWDDFMPQEEAHYLYGRFLINQNNYEEARKMFEKANYLAFQNGYMGWYGLACLEAKQKHEKQALDYLEKALNCYYPRPDPILKEPLFERIRKTKQFKEMLERNFHPGWDKK